MAVPVLSLARGVFVTEPKGSIAPPAGSMLVEITDSTGRPIVTAFIPREHVGPLLDTFADAWLDLHDPAVAIALTEPPSLSLVK